MPKDSHRDAGRSASPPRDCGPFLPGAIVVVTLGNPRDKFWGMILALAPEGLSVSGRELASFEDLVVMVKDGESFSAAVVFFPMHRIERIELDLPFALPAFYRKNRPRPHRGIGPCRGPRGRSAQRRFVFRQNCPGSPA
jgi:hypothetical protein